MNKYIYAIVSCPVIKWNLNINNSKSLKIKSIDDCYILNPYFYSNAYWKFNFLGKYSGHYLNDVLLIETSGLIIKMRQKNVGFDGTEFNYKLSKFFNYVRYKSMQFDLPNIFGVSSMYFEKSIPKGQRNTFSKSDFDTFYVRPNSYFSRIEWNELHTADKMAISNIEIPIFKGLFLDVLSDYYSFQYRKSLLLLVIALETFLNFKFEESYQEIINKRKSSKRFRVVNNDGFQEPIYLLLKKQKDFKYLLHHIPLYLSGKSLLLENKSLYDKVIKLHSVRNDLVHRGQIVNVKESEFEISQVGLLNSINTVNEVMTWFGHKEFEKLIPIGKIELDKLSNYIK